MKVWRGYSALAMVLALCLVCAMFLGCAGYQLQKKQPTAETAAVEADAGPEAPEPSYHDFEDVRRRVPDLTRIRNTIAYQPQYSLDDIIRDVWRDYAQ